MTLEEARALAGQPIRVVYQPDHDAPPEDGVITSVSEQYVFVRYGGDTFSQATKAGYLSLMSPQW